MKGLNNILSLSNAEKILLVEKIWDSIDHDTLELTEGQKQELDNRLKKYEQGEMKFSTWEEVRETVRSLPN